ADLFTHALGLHEGQVIVEPAETWPSRSSGLLPAACPINRKEGRHGNKNPQNEPGFQSLAFQPTTEAMPRAPSAEIPSPIPSQATRAVPATPLPLAGGYSDYID